MIDTPNNFAGRQAINRRVFEFQRQICSQIQPSAVDKHDHLHGDRDTDQPFSRADVRLEIQKLWWQL